jgi:competence protein ComEC
VTELKVIFADVGQGDCSLLQLPDGRFMLIDIMRCPGEGIDVFKLLDEVLPDGSDGRKRLDILVITHAHDDHITGIGDLYERYEIEYLWVPQHEDRKKVAKHFGDYQKVVDEHPEDKVLRPQGSRTPLNEKDELYSLGEGVEVRCFSPPGYIEIDESLTEEEAKQKVHENCLVMRISYQDTAVMFTGDSNVACWKRIVEYYPDEVEEDVLASNVLHASHHGSRTFVKDGGKDSEAWTDALDEMAPGDIIVSVGKDNRHDHPHEDMMDLYREAAGDGGVHNTSEVGTIVATIDESDGLDVVADDSYAEQYAWDDDEDGGDGDKGDNGGGGGQARARKPPAVPPPGFENTPQRAPRRERYAAS